MTRILDPAIEHAFDRVVARTQHDPHRLLGIHAAPDGAVVRVYEPRGGVPALVVDDQVSSMRCVDRRGLFELSVPGGCARAPYRVLRPGADEPVDDPYRFLPALGDLDLHLFGEGQHRELGHVLGAQVREHDGVLGASFAVWAPAAHSVALVGDCTQWDDRVLPMRSLGASGVWELFVPGVGDGMRYKFAVHGADGTVRLHADPVAAWSEVAPANASVVFSSSFDWADATWMARRASEVSAPRPMSVYEVHPGSWRPGLDWRALATELADYVTDLGFTHVELMAVLEHPFSGSWGYQVTGYYAPSARWGTPDDFRAFVDELHRRDIGVIVDWVPAHFPRDDWALARFDGTALYEHDDPRQGAHPDWGTLIFNYGRTEVRNFLLASAAAWVRDFHVDALRVDAVASMLYLDYSREPGEWLPNIRGGRENLDAVRFLRDLNSWLPDVAPGAYAIAEESTAWPGVTTPVRDGGLGFGLKWNMGWMHDTLEYFQREAIHRRFHQDELTFAMVYAYSERYVLPLSHDEVVHGKRSLVGRMPGDRWQQFANLRALYAYMWAHPGRKLLFMGGELAQEHEWDHEHALDWPALDVPGHRGVQSLVRDLNHRYRAEPALWAGDDDPQAFSWLEGTDADHNVFAFVRHDPSGGRPVVCVANLSPVPRHEYGIALPAAGDWEELIDTDSRFYGGSDVGNGGSVTVTASGDSQARLVLPPLGVLWLAPHVGSP
ncbi:MAG TPA: 1,4-alpha-glucan branching protein GlgB [Acidimicrobiia bacterium]